MPLTLPTADGQSVGDFMEELRNAVTMRLRGLAPMGEDPWIRIEDDGLTGDSVIGEICGTGGDAYYRMNYSRGEDGRLVLSEPVRVDEVTTYVDAPGPLPLSAVLCEMAPVHAPPADGLVKGRVAQLMRVGPLHDAYTGEHLLDVTDELLASIVTAAGAGFSIPIDYAHALYGAQAGGTDAAAVPLYGRVTALEHRPGDGLYGVPEYTAAGAAMLGANPGLLFFSPTLVGTMHDPATGKPLGRGLHSVSLTPTPRQNNIDSLALSRAANGAGAPNAKGPLMADNKGAGPTPETLTLERDALKGQVVELQRKLDEKSQAEVGLSQRVETMAAELAAERVERAAEKLAAEVKAEVDAAEKSGRVVPLSLVPVLTKLDKGDRAAMLAAIPASRPMAPVGHGGAGEVLPETDPRVIRAAVELSRKDGTNYNDALRLVAAQGVA